jgi:putative transposase
MPRIARIVIPGCPHHVTQRGNHRQKVFFTDAERGFYLELLRKYFTRFEVEMAGYGLMSNHVHFVLIPVMQASPAKGVGLLHNDFSRWQQIQRNLTGHLWQNRFFSCPLDEDHFWEALRYTELNPVRAGLVRYAGVALVQCPCSCDRQRRNGVPDQVRPGKRQVEFRGYGACHHNCRSPRRLL